MDTHFLSRFTPSLMTSDTLEALFVQREKLLQHILGTVAAGIQGSPKKNTLLVGPRGIGKTHLISLLYYRLQAMEALKGRTQIAWLREEEWGVACFRDFLLRILRALPSDGSHDPDIENRLSAIYELDAKESETAASTLIKEQVGNRTLVILAENFDDLVQKLGNMGEMQLYRFLQNAIDCILIATSPGPIDRVLPQGSPFQQDFFEVRKLQELSYDDAIRLISRIARYQGDTALSAAIASPRGRARIRALQYLAGGNHRAYITFAPLLTQESLDDLIRPLLQTIDDLTPYYNARIAILSPEQRKIIEYVCEERHPVQCADAARSCFLAPRIASAHMDALCRMGHLQSFRIGEATYYELHEPLMRLSFEVKKHRGKPIGLLLDFLRLWYSPAELKQKLSVLSPLNTPEHPYMPPPQVLEQKWEDPRVADCCREYRAAMQQSNHGQALQAVADLVAIRGLSQDLLLYASSLIRCGQNEPALSIYNKLLDDNRQDAVTWQLRGWLLNTMGRWEDALASCDQSLAIDSQIGRTWCYKASILLNLARPEEALAACKAALNLNASDPLAWLTQGTILADLSLFDEALEAFSRAVEAEPNYAKARIHRCAALIELNRYEEAATEAQHAIELDHSVCESWVMMGLALSHLGQEGESLYAFNKAISLGENSSFVIYKVVELLFKQNRWREGAGSLDKALAQFAHSDSPNAGNTGALIRCLLPNRSCPEILALLIKLLVLIYRKHSMLGALGQGLIESIPEAISTTAARDTDAVQWLECWRQTTAEFVEFRLPLRLLLSAIRFYKTQDLRIFMDLPQEERTLLEPLVGIHIEAIA